MMGGILVLALGALAALAASSYWFGIRTESEYNAMIQRSAEWQHFKLTAHEYTRGVFHSEARATLELREPPPSVQDASTDEESFPFTVILAHEITHGPVPFGMFPNGARVLRPALGVIETKLTLDPRLRELFEKIRLNDQEFPTMDVITVLKWGGDGETDLIVHPYRGEVGEESKLGLDFHGLKSTIHFSPGFKQFKGTLSLDGLTAASPGEVDFSLKGMHCTFDQFEGQSGFYLGDVNYGLERMAMKHSDPADANQDFSFQGLTLRTQARESGPNLSSSAVLALDRLNAGPESYERAGFEVELRKLDSAALGDFQKTMKELRRQHGSTERLSEETLAAFLILLPRLLKHSPEVELKEVGFVSTGGEVRASARLSFDGARIRSPLSFPMLLQSAQMETTLTAAETPLVRLLASMGSRETPAAVADADVNGPAGSETAKDPEADVRSTLAVLVAQKYLLLENGIYSASARFSGGLLSLNGQVIRLDQLLGQ
jgi:uncharacterized protein YdgA (DUF945 family)